VLHHTDEPYHASARSSPSRVLASRTTILPLWAQLLHLPSRQRAPLFQRTAHLWQAFLARILPPLDIESLREARALLATRETGRRIVLAADGGIRERTVPGLRWAGADTIVMGSLAFAADNLADRMAWVHALPKEPL
jgi:hypothetical protein